MKEITNGHQRKLLLDIGTEHWLLEQEGLKGHQAILLLLGMDPQSFWSKGVVKAASKWVVRSLLETVSAAIEEYMSIEMAVFRT